MKSTITITKNNHGGVEKLLKPLSIINILKGSLLSDCIIVNSRGSFINTMLLYCCSAIFLIFHLVSVFINIIYKYTICDAKNHQITNLPSPTLKFLSITIYIVETLINIIAILNSILFKRKLMSRFLLSMKRIEHFLMPKRCLPLLHYIFLIIILILIAIFLLFSNYFYYRITYYKSSNSVICYNLLDGFNEFLSFINVLTYTNLLYIIYVYFMEMSRYIQLYIKQNCYHHDESIVFEIYDQTRYCYKHLLDAIELWNNIYGVQLLMSYLLIFINAVNNINAIVKTPPSFLNGEDEFVQSILIKTISFFIFLVILFVILKQ